MSAYFSRGGKFFLGGFSPPGYGPSHKSINGVLSGPTNHALQVIFYQAQ